MSDFEFRNKFYEEMAEKILQHKDYGTKNPVDIGIACGYTENDVLELMRAIQKMQSDVENKSEKYYFLLQGYIVSVDIKSWKVEIVKKIHHFQENIFSAKAGDKWVNRWCIKNNIFVYTMVTAGEDIRSYNEKEVFWENLETGEQKRLLTDENVTNILIRKSDVCIVTTTDIILWKKDGTVYKKEWHRRRNLFFEENDLLVEAEDCIYVIDDNSVYKIDCDLNSQEIWNHYNGSEASLFKMGAVEFVNGKLSWYGYQENVHLFSDSSWSIRKYIEGESSYSIDSTGFYPWKLDAGILLGVSTLNYRLLQNEIWSMDNKHKICEFNRDISKETHQGQVIAISEKDIFIGVSKGGENLIKIDLRSERVPVILPVQYPESKKESEISSKESFGDKLRTIFES